MTPTSHYENAPNDKSIITFSARYNEYNATFPNSPENEIGVTVYNQYLPRITSRPTVMPDRVCVDLASSTIGVHNFGDYASSGTPDSKLYDQFAIALMCTESRMRRGVGQVQRQKELL